MKRAMKLPNWLTQLKSMTPEIKLTLLLTAVSFCISGMPRLYTQTAAHTLFLEQYGAAALPYAYLGQALCVPLAGWLYMVAEHRTSLRNLLIGTLFIDMVVQIGFHLAVSFQIPYAVAGTIVWFEMEFVLTSLCLWGLANSMMTLRQGKRLFGFVSAGEPIAVILCGVTMPLLLRKLETADLFLLSALGAGLGIVLVWYITANFRPPGEYEGNDENSQPADVDSADGAASPWWRGRYVLVMTAVVAISQLCYFLVDNTFYMEVDARYPHEADLANFLGLYSAVMGTVSLICSVVLAAPLVRRFGVRGALLTLPLLLVAGALTVVFAGWFGAGAEVLFWLVTMNKVIDQSFRYTLDKTNSVTLYQPLPERQRMKVQAALESFIEPLAGGLAAIALYAFATWFGFTAFHITHVIAVFAMAWAAMVFVQHKGYLGALNLALARRGLKAGELGLNDAEAIKALKRSLSSERPMEVISALKLLDDAGWQADTANTQALLAHSSVEVRTEAASRIEAGQLPLAASAIGAYILAEQDPVVRGALIKVLCAAKLPEAHATIAPYLDDTNAEVRRCAYVGMLRHADAEGEKFAGDLLTEAATHADPLQRAFAATVIEHFGAQRFLHLLDPMLVDDDLDVRRAALRAAGALKVPRFWPAIFANFLVPGVDQQAIYAAQSVGAALMPSAISTFENADASFAMRRAVIVVVGKVGTAEAMQWLIGLLVHADRRLSTEALHMLWLRRHKAELTNYPVLRHALVTEVEEAGRLLASWKGVNPDTKSRKALRQALSGEVNDVVHNLFRLMSMLLEGVNLREAYINYTKGGPVRRSYVIEMLDNALHRELKPLLLPIIEAESMAERAQHIPLGAELSDVVVARLALERLGRLSDWTQTCALYALADAEVAQEKLQPLLDRGAQSVRETSQWLLDGSPGIDADRSMLIFEKVQMLQNVELFSKVSEQQLSQLSASATKVALRKGDVLFNKGDLGTSLYVVLSGKLRVHVGDHTIVELDDGQVVGELAALDPEPRSASVSAIEDSQLLCIDSTDFNLCLSTDASLARSIIQALCQRLRANADKVPAKAVVAGSGKNLRAANMINRSPQGGQKKLTIEKMLMLRSVGVFSEVSQDHLSHLAVMAKEVSLSPGEPLFAKGDLGTALYVIMEGRVKVHVDDYVIAELGECQVVGEMAALDPEPRSASVSATEHSLLLCISSDDLDLLLDDDREAARSIIQVLCQRLRNGV